VHEFVSPVKLANADRNVDRKWHVPHRFNNTSNKGRAREKTILAIQPQDADAGLMMLV